MPAAELKVMSLIQADQVWRVLESIGGAYAGSRDSFILEFTRPNPCREWRFGGVFGFGGKFRMHRMQIDFYREDSTPEREELARKINAKLGELMAEWIAAGALIDLEEPTSCADIEHCLYLRLSSDLIETGLYHAGILYVVLDRVLREDGLDEVTFTWFEAIEPLLDLGDAQTTEDIEGLLTEMLLRDKLETGLYSTGLSYVLVDRVADKPVFTWFESMTYFDDVLANA